MESYILKEINGSPLIFFAPVKGMGTYVLEGTFKISNSGVVNHEENPSEIIVNGQSTSVSINTERGILGTILLVIRSSSSLIIPITLTVVALLGVAYIYFNKPKAPFRELDHKPQLFHNE